MRALLFVLILSSLFAFHHSDAATLAEYLRARIDAVGKDPDHREMKLEELRARLLKVQQGPRSACTVRSAEVYSSPQASYLVAEDEYSGPVLIAFLRGSRGDLGMEIIRNSNLLAVENGSRLVVTYDMTAAPSLPWFTTPLLKFALRDAVTRMMVLEFQDGWLTWAGSTFSLGSPLVGLGTGRGMEHDWFLCGVASY